MYVCTHPLPYPQGDKLRFLEAEKVELMLKPRGKILIAKYTELVREGQGKMKDLEKNVAEKQKMLVLLEKDKKTPKGALILGEGELKKAKQALVDQQAEIERLVGCDEGVGGGVTGWEVR